MAQTVTQKDSAFGDELEQVFVLPASFAQQRMWFLNELWPEAGLYNVPLALRLRGPLDPDQVRTAFDRLVQRHEALRTNLQWDEEGVVQLIHPQRQCQWRFVDLRTTVGKDDMTWQQMVTEHQQRPFSLEHDPLLRVLLLQIGPEEWILSLVLHHAMCDEWSMRILLDELSALLPSGTDGKPQRHLPPLRIQYGDYAVWQQQLLSEQRLDGQLQFWKEVFAQPLEPLELRTDFPRPAVMTHRGTHIDFSLDAEVTRGLRDVCRQLRCTMFTLLLSAYRLLLYRYSGQTDICIGCPVSGRNRPELESVVGLFLNTLPYRIRLAPSDTFGELTRQIQAFSLQAQANADIPFDQLIEHIDSPRDSSRTPLFQTLMTYQAEPALPPNLPGLQCEFVDLPRGVSRFDLALYIEDRRDRLLGELEFNTDLFELSSAQQLVRHFQHLLGRLPEHLDTPLAKMPILPEQDVHFELDQCNRTAQRWPDHDLSALFRRQAERRQQATAVVDRRGRWDYTTLFHCVDQAKQVLRRAGVSRGSVVAVQLERRAEMVAWLLAIWELGAAYVPIDPSFPLARRQYILQDCGAKFAITDLVDGSSDSLLAEFSGTVIRSTELHDAGQVVEPIPLPVLDGDQLAYVIYTSGSTGEPKGVRIPRRAVKNFLLSMQQEPGFSPADRLLAITTLSFDISVLELFLPLSSGGQVVIASRDDALDGNRLGRLLEEHQITVLQATPAGWQLLVESGWSGKSDLKMLCGGEALSAELAEQLLARGGELWNMYGPTETTVWSAIERISHDTLRPITIGRPIANTRLLVLSDAHEPQPVGVPGTLFIGGEGVGLGYHDKPELTKEKFLADPFKAGETMYNTGDTVCRLRDGRLMYLGRSDGQVKVRGFRIEIGEIEATLRKLPGVEQSCVTIWQPDGRAGEADRQIVAYLRWKSSAHRMDAAELRRQLSQFLPDYMLPAHFVNVDHFPQTPNRKIDRRRLPPPNVTISDEAARARPPRTELERQIAAIWCDVLGRRSIGVNEDFFALGGSSLAAARMINRLSNQLGRPLPLALLLRAGTIAELAREIEKTHQRSDWDLVVPLRAGGTKTPLFCVHAAGGNVLLYRHLAQQVAADRPVYGIQSEALETGTPQVATVEELAALYVREMQRIQPSGPYVLAGYCLGGTIAYEMAQQLTAAGHEVACVALFDTHAVWHQVSLTTELVTLVQKIVFHTRNVLLAGPRGMWAFLREKAAEATRRLRWRWRVLGSHIAHRLGWRESPPIRMLDRYYDRITEQYQPRPYSGRVVVFKPQAAYVAYQDPTMGWSDLVENLEIVSLPVYPAGMLMPPLVAELAEQLEQRLAGV